MERGMRLVSVAFVLVLLFVATEMGPMVVEGRSTKGPMPLESRSTKKVPPKPKKSTCQAQSNKSKGMCFWKSSCANICKLEGFTGGECHGFPRRCVCSKRC